MPLETIRALELIKGRLHHGNWTNLPQNLNQKTEAIRIHQIRKLFSTTFNILPKYKQGGKYHHLYLVTFEMAKLSAEIDDV